MDIKSATDFLLSMGRPEKLFETDRPAMVVNIVRAKNVGDLAYQFLRDYCPGATVPELHKKMSETGASIGSSEYLYTVCKRLQKKGIIARVDSADGKLKYVVCKG